MLLSSGLLFGGIIETIEGFAAPYLEMALGFLDTQAVWIQAAILVGIALFAIIGVFVFIKKFIKLFVVLGIIGVVGYLVWTNTTIIQDLLAGVMPGFIGSLF